MESNPDNTIIPENFSTMRGRHLKKKQKKTKKKVRLRQKKSLA